VIKPRFDFAWDFKHGLAMVNMGGKMNSYGNTEGGTWGYLDRTGKYVWKSGE